MPPSKKKSSSGKNDMAPAAEPAIAAGEMPAPANPCLVVGIGASAGGQEALEQLFTAMPPDCGLAFVVVMHLPPDGPSFLAEMLGRITSMAVVTAEEGMPLKPDTVHVIPAGRELTVSGGLLRLGEPALRGAQHPIDSLFRSLAAELKERAVAVVLSGFGTDGAEGVKGIREAGGIVMVQEPGSALNPAMPQSAIATGTADFILPPEDIPEKIAEIARGTCTLAPRACRTATLEEELHSVFSIVKAKTGHDFSSYKTNTVLRRIERRMAVNEVGGVGKYVALLEENAQEAQALCQDILIGVTSFFRDSEAFEVLKREIIPRLFAGRDSDDPVRIWHACCATGEEVYSTAILIREYLDQQRMTAKVQFFATDIDEAAISQARAGLYPDDIAAEMGEERLKTFFTRSDNRWQVAKSLREMIVFAHHSLIKDPPFSKLDLLVCRNFLIYLNSDMQKRLVPLFHMVLKPRGILFLGASETVGRNSDLFTPVDKKWKIFERLESGRREETLFPFTTPIRRLPRSGPPPRRPETGEPPPGAVAERLLLERYSPPCVVVNEKYEVIHVSTRTSRFLEVPVGEPTRDILKMAGEELRPALRAAIYKAFAEQREVAFRGVKVAGGKEEATVNVLVEPLKTISSAERLVMVILEPVALPEVPAAAVGAEKGRLGDEATREMLIRQLEEQLRVNHEQLQATSEQLETSNEGFMSANEELMSINEEFQSTNEELQSTNEELETSKEELQALNEELVTVNAELQGKVEELNQANSDMENLLTSSEIATLFLDKRLNIKGFTPAMAAIFNLIPADIGRPFRHLAGTIDWSGLARDAEEVLEKLLPIEREVAAVEDGRCFIMRVLPYRTTGGAVEGIIVTLIDITERKRMEEQTAHLASFPQLNPNPVLEVDSAGNFTYFNPATEKVLVGLGKQGADAALFLPADMGGILESWDRVNEATFYREIVIQERVFGGTIFLTPRFDVARIYAYDITERKQAQEALAESEQSVRRKLDSIISPEGDIGNLDLADIIDAPSLQALVDDFYELTRMPMGLIDLKGKVLVGVGWQDVCTQFHRVNPETYRNCVESDVRLSAGVPHGEYKIYKCENNMWDVATPVMVGERQFGNLFMGQFFFEDEPLDYELFRSQSRQYGFDEKEYIAALEAVPRLSRETLNTSMAFFMKLADILSKLSYSNLKLARSLAERDTLMEATRKSEEQFRTLADSIPNLAWWANSDGYITWYNQRWYEYTGTTPEQMEGWGWQSVHDPKVLPKVLERWKASIATGQPFDMEFPLLGADGVFRSFLTRVQPVKDSAGQVLRWFGTNTDISALKQAEVALQESELFYRQMLESIPGMVFTTRPDGYCDYQSQQWVDFTGVPMSEHLGDGWNKLLHPDDRPRAYAAWRAAVDERAPYDLEYRVRRHDGVYEWFKVRGRPIRNAAGEIARWFGTALNIDQLVKVEEALRRAHDELEKRVNERTVELATTVETLLGEITERERAEQALRAETSKRIQAVEELRVREQMLMQQNRQAAMGEMIGNIAHQWRQPLNTLGLIIQELPMSYDAGMLTSEDLEASVSKAKQVIYHMSQTIDDFRNFFRPDKEKVPFNVNDIVARTVSLIDGSLREQRIKIEISAQEAISIHGYPNEYSQVILNILINARDAFAERKADGPRIVLVRLFREDDKAVLTITDNAGGIAAEIMEKIFEPYFTTKGPDKGTGVGLFMSKTIIEKNMGGRLSACNSGNGTEFRIEV
jgi:two-component system CheB/CheR fusion protein